MRRSCSAAATSGPRRHVYLANPPKPHLCGPHVEHHLAEARAGRFRIENLLFHPADELAAVVLGHLVGEREVHPARERLLFLRRDAARQVAGRLEAAGYLTMTSARRPWRTGRRVPVNADCAFAPLARVQHALRSSWPAQVQGVVLAGLADACGLGPRLQAYMPPNALGGLDQAVGQLGPDLRELIAQTQAAVDSAVLASRA